MKICLQQVEFKAIRTGLCFLAAAGNYYLKGTNQMGVTGSGGVLPRWKKRGSSARGNNVAKRALQFRNKARLSPKIFD